MIMSETEHIAYVNIQQFFIPPAFTADFVKTELLKHETKKV